MSFLTQLGSVLADSPVLGVAAIVVTVTFAVITGQLAYGDFRHGGQR